MLLYTLKSIFRLTLALALLGVVAPSRSMPREASSVPDEYEIKAALLYKFARFVEWPSGALEGPDSPLIFGVFGKDPFGKKLDAVLAGRTVRGRKLEARRFEAVKDLGRCHVLFVSESSAGRLPEIRAAQKGSAVLLVGDVERFAHNGGHLNFYARGGSVRFEINDGKAKKDGLRIDARLLQLARIVRD